jgi:hypothetical protein
MKILIVVFLVILNSQAMASWDQPSLSCKSLTVVEGWSGVSTRDYVYYTATILNSRTLSQVLISGAYSATTGVNEVRAKADPTDKYPRYQFSAVEDAWHWFFLLVPKNYLNVKSPFKAALQVFTEDSPTPQYIDMECGLIYKI